MTHRAENSYISPVCAPWHYSCRELWREKEEIILNYMAHSGDITALSSVSSPFHRSCRELWRDKEEIRLNYMAHSSISWFFFTITLFVSRAVERKWKRSDQVPWHNYPFHRPDFALKSGQKRIKIKLNALFKVKIYIELIGIVKELILWHCTYD